MKAFGEDLILVSKEIGNTPLVRLKHIPGQLNDSKNNIFLAKLEGNNPAGSVKDRAAVSMIMGAESRGSIKKKDVLIEATSGNTGIALAMAARLLDYKMRLIMPENLSIERRQVMKAFGEDLILVSKEIGNTPLVRLKHIPGQLNDSKNNIFLAKLEGNNPAGSVKDRAAVSMIMGAESRGSIKKKDVLIEATSGNTGIALAMAARLLDYKMRLIMPENLSIERRQVMKAFGEDLILVSKEIGMEGARDLANEMEKKGEGRVLNQLSSFEN
jgi:cysteine synthase